MFHIYIRHSPPLTAAKPGGSLGSRQYVPGTGGGVDIMWLPPPVCSNASIKSASGIGLGADMDQLGGEEKRRRRLVYGAVGLTRAAA